MCRIDELAKNLVLGALLDDLVEAYDGYELVAHWQQGEFHHDIVVAVRDASDLPGNVLVISTNCNGGIKEVMAFARAPAETSSGNIVAPPEILHFPVLGASRTIHWFDPCELLTEDARSELRPEFRRRQEGGGWEPIETRKGCRR